MQATERGTGMERSRSGVGNVGARGFTLIEMIVVIVIFMILMGLGLIAYDSMKVDNALNASAMELAATFREARGLALRHQRHYTVAFSAIKEDWSGEGDWERIGEATDNDNRHFENATTPDIGARSGLDFQQQFRSDNENGTDHWYAIYKPVKYGSQGPYGDTGEQATGLPDIYRPVAWWHLYERGSSGDTRFDERKYDPHRLQVGSRRFLQRGVRFWQFNFEPDDVVEDGGDLTDYVKYKKDDGTLWRYRGRGEGNDYFWGADDAAGTRIVMAMLMGPTTIRTLQASSDRGIGRADRLVAFPDGTFGHPGSVGMFTREHLQAYPPDPWETRSERRRSSYHIANANYSGQGSLTEGGGTGFDRRRRFVIGLVWREDRTKKRSVQINHTNGEVRIRREWDLEKD